MQRKQNRQREVTHHRCSRSRVTPPQRSRHHTQRAQQQTTQTGGHAAHHLRFGVVTGDNVRHATHTVFFGRWRRCRSSNRSSRSGRSGRSSSSSPLCLALLGNFGGGAGAALETLLGKSGLSLALTLLRKQLLPFKLSLRKHPTDQTDNNTSAQQISEVGLPVCNQAATTHRAQTKSNRLGHLQRRTYSCCYCHLALFLCSNSGLHARRNRELCTRRMNKPSQLTALDKP